MVHNTLKIARGSLSVKLASGFSRGELFAQTESAETLDGRRINPGDIFFVSNNIAALPIVSQGSMAAGYLDNLIKIGQKNAVKLGNTSISSFNSSTILEPNTIYRYTGNTDVDSVSIGQTNYTIVDDANHGSDKLTQNDLFIVDTTSNEIIKLNSSISADKLEYNNSGTHNSADTFQDAITELSKLGLSIKFSDYVVSINAASSEEINNNVLTKQSKADVIAAIKAAATSIASGEAIYGLLFHIKGFDSTGVNSTESIRYIDNSANIDIFPEDYVALYKNGSNENIFHIKLHKNADEVEFEGWDSVNLPIDSELRNDSSNNVADALNALGANKADLDSNKKIPTSQIPDVLFGDLSYRASVTSLYELTNLAQNPETNESSTYTPTKGHYYIYNGPDVEITKDNNGDNRAERWTLTWTDNSTSQSIVLDSGSQSAGTNNIDAIGPGIILTYNEQSTQQIRKGDWLVIDEVAHDKITKLSIADHSEGFTGVSVNGQSHNRTVSFVDSKLSGTLSNEDAVTFTVNGDTITLNIPNAAVITDATAQNSNNIVYRDGKELKNISGLTFESNPSNDDKHFTKSWTDASSGTAQTKTANFDLPNDDGTIITDESVIDGGDWTTAQVQGE